MSELSAPASSNSSVTALPDLAVSIRGLTKVYGASGAAGAKKALDDVDLDIPRGSLFALLGPNGAGKSTLINILAQLVVKSSGNVKIWDIDLDRDPRHAAAAIGVVPQELNVDPFFTPQALLDLQAGMYGVPKAERRTKELLAALSLSDKANSYSRTLSGGMRRRLMVAKAMVHNPPVLVLDEPTAGVDVELRQQLWAYVRELNARGVTVLLTTHYLEEAEELCDRIAIINHGKVIAHETKEALLGRLDNKELLITLDRDIELSQLSADLEKFHTEKLSSRRLRLRYRPSQVMVDEILGVLRQGGLQIVDLSTVETDLEDIFLQLTRRGAGE
ncbi:ABC transporter ATP-binding protein [Dongia soli]|uniref:ABC transporter ATP-binding protein n=1 Tax=Dongia soli TaxID=600628 RepID=A0ABU5E788_9PROT|nr:ABC transporter ATP-binding protein [Dongia soli]MDY0881495.1 ABC transporter ATP-binding protein [Dongia soli]